jgi:hypothetical protein
VGGEQWAVTVQLLNAAVTAGIVNIQQALSEQSSKYECDKGCRSVIEANDVETDYERKGTDGGQGGLETWQCRRFQLSSSSQT